MLEKNANLQVFLPRIYLFATKLRDAGSKHPQRRTSLNRKYRLSERKDETVGCGTLEGVGYSG